VEKDFRRCRAELRKGDPHRPCRKLRLNDGARDFHLHMLGGLLANRRLQLRWKEIRDRL
jgi:hypothetical protein